MSYDAFDWGPRVNIMDMPEAIAILGRPVWQVLTDTW
jgi:hypothetical protein